MNFDFTEEQRLLRDSVERFAQTFKVSGQHPLQRLWRGLAELGVLGLPFAEEDGGFGGSPIETMIVMEAIGGGLLRAPYLTAVALCGTLLRCSGTDRQRRELIPGIAGGTTLLAFAHQEPQARYDLADVVTSASQEAGGWVLNGVKCGVVAGDTADLLIVSARTHHDRYHHDGLRLFLVDPETKGVSRRGYVGLDGLAGADVSFDEVRIGPDALLGRHAEAYGIIENAVDVALAASFAESVGIMQAMLNETVAYLKTRSQFGKKIGEFQALRHRAVEMLIATEQARSMAIFAAARVAAEDAQERRRAVSGAKVQISQALRFVSQWAVQLHGGLGVTEECIIGPYFKRATALEPFFGDFEHHLASLADAGGFIEPESMGTAE